MSFLNSRNLEGLGGPVNLERYSLEGIDPTLDSCCQREEADSRRAGALRRTLQRFDVVAEKERRRRHLVTTEAFDGCRCCYDPNSDGGEYRALMELRNARRHQNTAQDFVEEAERELEEKENQKVLNSTVEDNDDEFDYLLDEDVPEESSELKALEEARRAELEWDILLREIAVQHGYGVHRQMHPNRVLKAAGLASSRKDESLPAVVLHLVDADSLASASLDLYLETLAASYPGTKFMRSGGRATLLMNAELASQALPKLLPDVDPPVLVAVRDGIAVNVCPQLQGLTNSSGGEIDPLAVHEWLDRSGVLLERIPRSVEVMCRIRPEEEALMDYLLTMKPQTQLEKRYDCGIATCSKSFPHEHIGEQNDQQAGLVVSEEQFSMPTT
jgi:hypothetical protein